MLKGYATRTQISIRGVQDRAQQNSVPILHILTPSLFSIGTTILENSL